MKKILFLFALVLSFTTQIAQAQTPKLKVGTNPTTLNASAALEVQSTTQGFLPPRMALSQITAINNPAIGLSIYCTDCYPAKTLLSFDGLNWINALGDVALNLSAPSVPNTPIATAGTGSASVAFTPPTTTGSGNIVSYTVISTPGNISVTGTSSPIVVPNLNAGTAYRFVVRATNASGLSSTSSLSTSVTPTASVPGVPTSLVASSTLGNTASIAFTPPTSNGGAAITAYKVTPSPATTPATFTGTTSPIAVTGLTNGTAYTFTMVATNSQGSSAATDPSNSVTPQGSVPGAPMIGTATVSGTTASVAFTAPTLDGGSAITGYTVTSNPGNITASGTTSPISVPGLVAGQIYRFTVVATNSVGNSLPSAISNAIRALGAPDAPSLVTAAAISGTSAQVNFVAPSNNGSNITGYTVTPSPATTPATFTGTASPITVTGLTANTAYTFSVTATNGIGTSAAGTTTFTPVNAVPSAPTAVTASGGDAQATVAFTAPTNNGGAAITGYTVTSTPGGFTASGASSPLTVPGLTNGTTYTFTVVATNSVGNSVASGLSNAVIPATTGTVLATALNSSNITAAAAYSVRKINSSYTGSALRVRRTSDNTEQNIGFTANGDLDETALSTFVGTGTTNHATVTVWYDQSGNERNLTQTTTGLQPYIVYQGTISKVNGKVGIDYNGTVQFLQTASSPLPNSEEVMLNIVQTERSRNSNFGFSFNDYNGGDINQRLLAHFPWSDGTNYFDWGTRLSFSRSVGTGTNVATTFTSSKLANSQTLRYNGVARAAGATNIYPTPSFFRLGVNSSTGPIAYFQEFIITSSVPTLSNIAALEANQAIYYGLTAIPGGISQTSVVSNVTATAGNATASVAFSTVPNATSYTVTSNPGNITATATSNPIQVNGLTNGTAYTFTVTATNAGGTSAVSAASNSVTPAAGAPSQTVASAPTNVNATAGNLFATVSFTAPANNGNAAITGYTVTSNPGNISVTGTSSPITVTGLSANTSYSFTVVANNAVGSSLPSLTSNVIAVASVPTKPVLGTPTTTGLSISIPVTVSNNGSAITSYTATINPGNITVTSLISPVLIDFPSAGTYVVTVTATNAIGTSVASDAINITAVSNTNAVLANTVTTLNSNGEPFNTNPNITANDLISVGVNCPSSVTWQGVTYPATNLGGICWMKQDFRGVPSNFASLPTTSWTSGFPNDFGSWGYFNYNVTNGSAGWASTPQSSNPSVEGYLYQWSAAMNGSTTNRAQGVCPTGWHLPSVLEFLYIWHVFGAPISTQTITSSTSFTPPNMAQVHSILGATTYTYRGSDQFNDGRFVASSFIGTWAWTSTQINTLHAFNVDFFQNGFHLSYNNVDSQKKRGLKVRCIKD